MPVQAEEAEDFKSKYKNLKRKLKILVYENECFQEELGKANRALLRVRQDKNFLLEQLLHYQQPPASSSDSDLTDNTDNESNVTVQSVKRKRFGDGITGTSAALPTVPSNAAGNSTGGRPSSSSGKPASKPTSSKQHCPTASSSGSTGGGGGGGVAAIVPAASKKRTLLSVNRAANKPANKNSSRQRRAPHKPLTAVGTLNAAGHRNAVHGSGSSCSARGTSDAVSVGGAEERELSREEVERHLLSRQTIADFHTPVSLTLPHQLFSDNLMDGDLLEEIETSPSNLEEDINVDNYE